MAKQMLEADMKNVLLSILLFPALSLADNLGDLYWSPYACDGYIYHFDDTKGEYEIYTRLDVKDEKHGAYKSYQLTEGKMEQKSGALYLLRSKDIGETMSIDFSGVNQAMMKSTKFGQALLIQCDKEKAKKLIDEAESHFKTCPKNALNCKNL
jgi:hypothetical protein